MKNKVIFTMAGLLLTAYFLMFAAGAYAQQIGVDKAKLAAKGKIHYLENNQNFQLNEEADIFTDSNGEPLFYMFAIEPKGYIAVSAHEQLPPVMAYSFTNDWGKNNPDNILIQLLTADLQWRKSQMNKLSQADISKIKNDWGTLISNPVKSVMFEQWPPSGSTSTGGWLETNWKQGSPYNQFVPMDPVTSQRAVAGCPSVALAMLINYYETTNGTQLSDAEDDYYHSYSGRNYYIDDDYESIDFLPFPEVNAYLDTISNTWASGSTAKPVEAAALIWACGVAAKQVYTSSISGTFGVDQAYDAFLRFGYADAALIYPNGMIVETLEQNMKDARPALLAVLDPGTAGHNLVTDGFNTDGYFHLNFGWGGSYNGWYHIPDEIPYNLTVFEGVVVNIAFPPVYTSSDRETNSDWKVQIYPNPAYEKLTIQTQFENGVQYGLEIFDLTGNALFAQRYESSRINLDLKSNLNLQPGVYFIKVTNGDSEILQKLIIR